MPATSTISLERARFWRRSPLARRRWVRHPVSPFRERIGQALLALIGLGFGLYSYTTRDEAIRKRTIEFLSAATGGQVRVERAQFRMFGGITLRDVHIAIPYNEELDRNAKDFAQREIFSARSLTLIHNPWQLIFGNLRVDHIIATQPRITVVHNVDSGVRNWQLLTSGRGKPGATRKGPIRLPRITIRSAEAVVVSTYSTGKREQRAEQLDADVRPHPQAESGYCIEVRRFSDPAERTTVLFDPGAQLVTNTPFVDARTVKLQLPKAAQQFFDRIDLRGEVKLTRLIYEAQSSDARDTEIELRRVRCAIPLSMLQSSRDRGGGGPDAPPIRPSPDSIVTMTDVHGKLQLRGGELEVEIAGRVNGAPCSVAGKLEGVGRDLGRIGIDVRVLGTKVPAPEGPLRDQIINDPVVPLTLKTIFAEYDPHGDFDVDFHFRRASGHDQTAEVIGMMRPLGASGKCAWFPYEVKELTGAVRFDGPMVHIEDLRGRHGSAAIRFDGNIDRRTEWSRVELNIDATAVPLDEELFQALSPHHQALWERFNPHGTTRLAVRMTRASAGGSEPVPPWETNVTADLIDGRVIFREYPYPLRDVHGRLELGPRRIQFVGLTGRHDEASVRIDGYADIDPAIEPRMELRLEARDMQLDAALADALPPEGRGAFEQFQPRGRVNLFGTVSLQNAKQGVVYDLLASVRDAAIRYQAFPYAIEEVSGEVNIRPEGFSIVNVEGRHGPAVIRAQGNVVRRATGFVADLEFDCRRIELSTELRDALPNPLRHVWDMFEPAGTVAVQTALHYVAEGDQVWQRHRTFIETESGSFCFRGFPLRVSEARGRALITDRRVEILAMRGRTSGGTVEGSGAIELTDLGPRATLRISGRDIPFTEEVFAALPERFREWIRKTEPRGRFSVTLDPLTCEPKENGESDWRFGGEFRLTKTDLNLGIEMRSADGLLTGSGEILSDGTVSAKGELLLDRAQLSGWQVENLKGTIVRDRAGDVMLDDLSAKVYGGEAGGSAHVRFGRSGADFRTNLIMRDVQLGEYLASMTPENKTSLRVERSRRPGPKTRGEIDGSLIIRGKSGPDEYLEGEGEIRVREAQVWRLPLVFAIFQVLNLTPDENVFHDGMLKYYLSGDQVKFQKIDLQGRALSLIGDGEMSWRTKEMDIVLLAGSPVRLRVPVLTELIEAASHEMMEVRVTGTMAKPTIRPQPMKTLNDLIRRLFPEKAKATKSK